jgi:phage gp36-like protein
MPDSYTYVTAADLTARYGALALLQLTDRDSIGVADPGMVDAACADATELMDGYLGERYSLPLTPVTGIVKGWACTIAWFKLNVSSPPPEVRTAYLDVIDQLSQARTGKLILQANGVPDAATPVNGAVLATDGAPRQFDHRSLRGF